MPFRPVDEPGDPLPHRDGVGVHGPVPAGRDLGERTPLSSRCCRYDSERSPVRTGTSGGRQRGTRPSGRRGRTAPPSTRRCRGPRPPGPCATLAAYSALEEVGARPTRSAKASRNFSASAPGWWTICLLRKQSSGARLPSMSTKLRMRPGFRWASSNAVSPPMEWPTRWNLSIRLGAGRARRCAPGTGPRRPRGPRSGTRAARRVVGEEATPGEGLLPREVGVVLLRRAEPVERHHRCPAALRVSVATDSSTRRG